MSDLLIFGNARLVRRLHPKPEVEAALKLAETQGWRVEVGGSHAWGRIYCPYNDDTCRCGEFCIASIWSTPKSAGNHAKQIKRIVENCVTHRNRLAARSSRPKDSK